MSQAFERNPREMEREARQLEEVDPERARDLYAEAAAAWNRGAEGAFAASRYIGCARKGDFDRPELVVEARELACRHREDAWVRSAYAWVCYDLARERIDARDPERAALALAEALDQVPATRDPTLLVERVALLAGRLSRRDDGAPAGPAGNQAACDLIGSHGDVFLEHLSAEPSGGSKLAPLEVFFYTCRRAASAGKVVLLERLMSAAVERYPKNEWFAEAHVRAAAMAGDAQRARERGEAAFDRFPESWAVAAARARVEIAAKSCSRAVEILEPACLAADAPWPWRELAAALEGCGRQKEAASALAAGLARHRPRRAGKVWRMHLERAELLEQAGDPDGSAAETWLAAEARRAGGWPPTPLLEARLREAARRAPEVIAKLEGSPPARARARALERYRRESDAWYARCAVEVEVTRYDESRGFGFAGTPDGSTAFLHRSALSGAAPETGEVVRAVVVPSLDRKKGRRGLKVLRLLRGERPGSA